MKTRLFFCFDTSENLKKIQIFFSAPNLIAMKLFISFVKNGESHLQNRSVAGVEEIDMEEIMMKRSGHVKKREKKRQR